MPAAQGGTPPRPLQVLLVSDSPADLAEVALRHCAPSQCFT